MNLKDSEIEQKLLKNETSHDYTQNDDKSNENVSILKKHENSALQIKDLENLNIKLSDISNYFSIYMIKGFPLALNKLSIMSVGQVSQFFIGWYQDPIQSGGFGVGNIVFMVFFNFVLSVLSEAFGIFLTEKYGSKDWKGLREVFLRGIGIFFVFVVVNLFWLSNIKPVQIFLNFELKIVEVVSSYMIVMIPSLVPIALNSILQAYQISQKITQPMIFLNFICFVQMLPLSYIYIWGLGLKLHGFAILRFTIETVYSIGAIIICKKYMDKRAYEFNETFKEVFNWEELKNQIKLVWPILYGSYASFLAIECTTIVVGSTHNIELLASWTINFNVMITPYIYCMGTAQITRTDVVISIQKNKPIEAKKYAYLGQIIVFIISSIMGLVVFVFSKEISRIFTSVPGVLEYLYYMVPISALIVIPNNMFATFGTILRVLKKSRLLAQIYLLSMFPLMVGGSFIIQYYTNYNKGCIIWTYFFARLIMCCLSLWLIKSLDWKKFQPN